MVRRVRLGRRHDRERPLPRHRWAGPPPLLLLATVAALAVSPFLDRTPSPPAARIEPAAVSVTSPRAVEPHTVLPPRVADSRGGLVVRGRSSKPAQPEIGVVSMNMLHSLTSAQAGADARRITRDRRVDIVGWQEANPFHRVLHSLRGWGTRTFPQSDGSSELAVSWRRSTFRMVSAYQRPLIEGVSARQGRYPFGDRSIAVVTLEHRRSGKRLAVVDVHLPPAIESLQRPGRWRPTLNAQGTRTQLRAVAWVWRQVRARWVIGTGDFNFDAGADLRHRTRGGPLRALGAEAVSSYEALGVRGLPPTFPSNGRHIDYVWVDRGALRHRDVELLGQSVGRGFNSDHRPLMVRLALS